MTNSNSGIIELFRSYKQYPVGMKSSIWYIFAIIFGYQITLQYYLSPKYALINRFSVNYNNKFHSTFFAFISLSLSLSLSVYVCQERKTETKRNDTTLLKGPFQQCFKTFSLEVIFS